MYYATHRSLLLLTAFTTINIPAIIFPFIVWDDWVVFGVDPELIQHAFDREGQPGSFVVQIFSYFSPESSAHIAAALSTSVYMVGVWISYQCALAIPHIPREWALIGALFMIVAPLNFAWPLANNMTYAISFPLFWSGVYLLIRWERFQNAPALIASLALLGLSFLTLPFAALFLAGFGLYMLKRENVIETVRLQTSWKGRLFSLRPRPSDVLLLGAPFASLAIKSIFFQPDADRGAYNQISIAALPEALWESFMYVLKLPMHLAFLAGETAWLWCFAIAGAVFAALYLRQGEREATSLPLRPVWGIVGAILILVAAVFPYVAVSKEPLFLDLHSRWQLTLQAAIGAAMVLFLSSFTKKLWPAYALLAVFAGLKLSVWTTMHRDLHVRDQVRWAVMSSGLIEDADVLLLRAPEAPFRRRPIAPVIGNQRFYEFTTPVSRMRGRQDRLILFTRRTIADEVAQLAAYCDLPNSARLHISDWPAAERVSVVVADVKVSTDYERFGLGWTAPLTWRRLQGAPQDPARESSLISITPTERLDIPNPC